jgi:hypothetical protein
MEVITLIGKTHNSAWKVLSNPTKQDIKNAMNFLSNSFNDYVEYHNCGVTYRFVRNKNLHLYGIRELTIDV